MLFIAGAAFLILLLSTLFLAIMSLDETMPNDQQLESAKRWTSKNKV